MFKSKIFMKEGGQKDSKEVEVECFINPNQITMCFPNGKDTNQVVCETEKGNFIVNTSWDEFQKLVPGFHKTKISMKENGVPDAKNIEVECLVNLEKISIIFQNGEAQNQVIFETPKGNFISNTTWDEVQKALKID